MLGTGIKHASDNPTEFLHQGDEGVYTHTSVSHQLRDACGVEISPALMACCERVE